MKSLKSLRPDVISGFLVFLIALPLCLGIAKASGFPPIAGIYTAVVGGLFVTFLSNSQLTIKGPAAGLIVIAIGAVDELGGADHIKGYQLTLAVVVISGLLQVVLGLVKSGRLGDFFPASVIHGMLAAIGVIIMSKQIHIAMGVVPEGKEPFELIEEIPHSLAHMNPEVALIGLFSMLVLFIHPLLKNKNLKRIPAPLLVLAIAIPLGFYFDLSHEHDYDLGSLHFHINPAQLLVALPDHFFNGITFPDFSQITSMTSIKYIIMFALVGSIESLLSAKAIDSLDPEHRKTNLDRDMIAVGVGNTIVGCIGGLPMISEIVRSSANINNGGKTRMSNFFHAIFLFLFALLAASLIQKIPNAALSAMLVYTGYKLAAPVEFKKVKSIGYDQLFLFIATLVVTILTDLLIGVGVGICLKLILQLMQGSSFKELFKLNWELIDNNGGKVIKLKGVANFVNFLKFKPFMETVPRDTNTLVDFSEVQLADHTFLENLHHLQNEFVQHGGQLVSTGFDGHNFQSSHHLASRKITVNPYVEKNPSTFNKRQAYFQTVSTDNGCDFESVIRPSVVRPYISPFSIVRRFRTAKNLIICNEEMFNVLIGDIEYDSIGDFTKERNIATIAVINNLDIDFIPEFILEKDTLIKDMSGKHGFERYKVNAVPSLDVFGKNEEDLKMFFKPQISKLLKDCGYTIESKRRSILIHQDLERLSGSTAVSNLLKFTKELAEVIVKGN